MADWHCFKDKVKMLETEVELSYMVLTKRVPGLRCPKGGEVYLTEEIVMTIVKDAEAVIEGK